MGSKTRRAKKAAEGKAGEGAGRAGLAARGTIYCVVGLLAIRLVTGADERVDREGALEALARQRVGTLLLALLALGFAGYAVWRLLRAFTGAKEGSREASGYRRAADVGRAALYAFLVFTTLKLLFGGRDQVGGQERERDWTISLLEQSWGRPVVLVAGVAAIVAGILVAGRGLQKDFTKSIDHSRVPTWARRLIPIVGTIGYVARGGVVSLVGWFVAHAAWTFDAQEAVGVAGALGRLADELYGRIALSAVAFGLLSFGIFSFVEAAYRKVLED